MKTVSVTRIFNEEDIVEAFVRHNATLVDQMLFLDNGSTDATLEILRALQAEGVALSVFQCRAVNFDEVAVNSWLYQLASQTQRADWHLWPGHRCLMRYCGKRLPIHRPIQAQRKLALI